MKEILLDNQFLIINIGFEVKPKNAPKCFGIEIYNCNHYQPLVKTNGIKIAFSIESTFEIKKSFLLYSFLSIFCDHFSCNLDYIFGFL